jgi:NAD(P)H-hydrate epimerase
MKAVTAAVMRELDRRVIQEQGVPAEVLMDRAGLGVAHHVRRLRRLALCEEQPVILVAGRRNNGGDAFAAARHLAGWRVPVRVLIAGRAEAVSETAAVHLRLLSESGVPVEERPDAGDWTSESCLPIMPRGVLVDGLLGNGFTGSPHGVVRDAISWIQAGSITNRIVSIDIPSGMDADSGSGDHVVRADMTVSIGLPKRGLLLPAALECVGQVRMADIGIPSAKIVGIESDVELITAEDVRLLMPRRVRNSHKGTFGTLLIIAGARGYAGAAAHAAMAALRAGVGLVHVATPRCVAGTVAAMVPEAIVHPVAETENGSIAETAWIDVVSFASKATAVAIGPGLTTHEAARHVLQRLLSLPVPVVVDADALNLLAGALHSLGERRAPTVLTPHPGEMARLLGMTGSLVQADRFGAVRSASALSKSVVVLKGAGTLVHENGGPVWVNMAGNPGMGTAGCGDVLCGVIGGMLAGGKSAMETALLSVYLHGVAGDMAAMRFSEPSICASDIIGSMPDAIAELGFR